MRRTLLALLTCLIACGSRSGLDPGQLIASAGTGAGAAQATGGSGSGSTGGSRPGPGSGGAPLGGSVSAGAGGFVSAGAGGFVSGGAGGVAMGGMLGDAGSAGEDPCPNGTDEVCNGIDDDCDGEIDEDLPLELVQGPVAVRVDEGSTDGGSTDSCISCSWGWHPQLVAPAEQLGVVWYLGISGGAEQPSAFYRRLSWELEPVGAVSSLGPQFWMQTLRRGETGPRGTLLTFVERANHQDLPSFGFVNSQFEASATVSLDGCGPGGASYALTPLFPGLVSCDRLNVLRLFAVDQQGSIVAEQAYEPELPGASLKLAGRAVAALNGERGLLALPVQRGVAGAPRELWTLEIAADGSPLSEPRLQKLDFVEQYSLYLEGLFAHAGGYLLFGDHRNSGVTWPGGRFVVPLARDGTLGEPYYHDDGTLADFSEVGVLRVGRGFIVAESTAAGLAILQVDENGIDALSEHHLDVSVYSEASLLYSHGHLFAAFAEPPTFSDAPNRMVTFRLSCRR